MLRIWVRPLTSICSMEANTACERKWSLRAGHETVDLVRRMAMSGTPDAVPFGLRPDPGVSWLFKRAGTAWTLEVYHSSQNPYQSSKLRRLRGNSVCCHPAVPISMEAQAGYRYRRRTRRTADLLCIIERY